MSKKPTKYKKRGPVTGAGGRVPLPEGQKRILISARVAPKTEKKFAKASVKHGGLGRLLDNLSENL